MGVEVRVERYDDVIEEIKPLLEMHWHEIATFKEAIPLDPDYERYRVMDESGMAVIIAARRDGRLVGYSIMFFVHHMHYRSTLFAANDILFLHPDERRGRTGVALIRASERIARERGARKISWHIKSAHDFSRLLVDHLGYQHDEVNVAKLLED